MTKDIDTLLLKQKAFFQSGATLPISFRLEMLKRLADTVSRHESELAEALKSDLGKSGYESFMCETGLTLTEITHMRRHLRKYMKPHTVHTPLAQFASHSFTQAMPLGNVLIMSPWNYPVLLTLDPLADAIAAGDTAILKPSAYSPATSDLLAKLLGEAFPEEYIAVVTGGRQENAALLDKKFDLVFFTGSQAVGREVLRHTAETLTPAVLELGGKSPCIVDSTAKLSLAARRIVFAKFLNCGQTCVAPDYVLAEKSIAAELQTAVKDEIRKQFGEHPLDHPDYGRIVNERHFNRLLGLMKNVACGGKSDPSALRIEPTVLTDISWDDAVMQQEIFGPILPILTYDRFEELYSLLRDRPKPLALYLFSENRQHIDTVLTRFPSGGCCINDAVIHLATSAMGFGGLGESGMGSYHGKAGFDAFSHTRSVVDKKTWLDLPMRYQPYDNKLYHKLLRMFLR